MNPCCRPLVFSAILLFALAGQVVSGATDRFLITDFGAVSDGSHVNTKEIQSAIDHCSGAGGGTVVVPAGTFLTGTLRLHSHVRLEVSSGGTLLGSPNLEDYPIPPRPAYHSLFDLSGFRALIYAEEQVEVSLGGQGTIDGQGEKFKWGGSDMDGRPKLLVFISCHGVRVEDLHLRNAGLFMQHYLNCEDVQLHGLRVWNHANRNNDMFDIDGCRRVTVSDCIGDSEDDGITIKSTGAAPCQDVAITNCVISSQCNAIKCGTASAGGFHNLTISNCVIKPSMAPNTISGDHPEGISGIALEIVDGGTLDGVAISNVSIEGTKVPIFIRLGNRARKYRKDMDTPPVGVLRNIRITNVIARDSGSAGCSITGIPGHPVENIWLSGISIELGKAAASASLGQLPAEKDAAYPEATMFGELPSYGFFVRHAKNVRFSNVEVTPHAGDPRPPFASDDVAGVKADQCSFSVDPKG